MIIINCSQGSEEWHVSRAGVITASCFKIARERVGLLTEQQENFCKAIIELGMSKKEAAYYAGYKTIPKSEKIDKALNGEKIIDFSENAKNYAFRLAVERISGIPLDDGFETWAMKRGHELEPMARNEHEIQLGVSVALSGFVTTDDSVFGASADGFIGDDGGCEYKCLVSPESIRKVLLKGDIGDYIDQIQGCMWITGRKYWHFAMYCPALEAAGKQLFWKHVDRDDDYIEDMEIDLLEFSKLVDEYQTKIMSNT